MEALTAVAVAALTIYDMGKSTDKAMTIDEIQLLEKSEAGAEDGRETEESLRHRRVRSPAGVPHIPLRAGRGQEAQRAARDPSSRGGVLGDAHFGTARPLSLLPLESFSKVRHPKLDVQPGDFAENVTTVGLDFSGIHIGTRLRLGAQIEVEVLQIGKECHNGASSGN